MLLNCDVGEDSESALDCKEIKPVNLNGNQFWIFTGRTDAEAEAPVLRPPDARADSLEKTPMLGKIEGRKRGDDRGWDGSMVSPTELTWVWASSRRWWRTKKPAVFQSMGSQRVGHDWVTEQQQLKGDPKIRLCGKILFRRIVSLSFWQTAPGVNDHIFPPLWKFSWALVENVMSFAMDSSVIHAFCK